MTEKADALLKIPSEVPSGKDVPFQDITVVPANEAKALDDIKLGEHVLALGGEFVKRAGSAVSFVMAHHAAIQELRTRYSAQGRRNPVPGSPTWGEFCTSSFHVTQQYMNSILAGAEGKNLAKKKTKKPSIPAATGTTVTDITTDSDPRTDGMDETAAQAVAVVATKLAKLVVNNTKVAEDARKLARSIVEVDKDEPFLPTVTNLVSNMGAVVRIWNETLHGRQYPLQESERKGLITKFVNKLSDEDFGLVLESCAARQKKGGISAEEQQAIQAVTDAKVPDETKVRMLKTLRDSKVEELDAIYRAREKKLNTFISVVREAEAAAKAAAASAPEPSDAELAKQALDFVQRVTQPSDEQEAA